MEKHIMLDAAAAEKLLAAGSADAALLYIHMLASPSPGTRPDSFDEGRFLRARAQLRALGLLPPEEVPPLSARELAEAARSRPDFRDGCAEAERLLGRLLSQAELERLYYIYDTLGFGGETIIVLLNDCVAEYRRRYGEPASPTVTYICRVASEWAALGIADAELAEEFIKLRNARRTAAARAARALGIAGRALSKSEEKYIDAWLSLGFGPDELEKAYDITVLRTGKLSWKYMDSILRSWQSKGLMTLDQIERGDRRPEPATAAIGEHERAAVERLRRKKEQA